MTWTLSRYRAGVLVEVRSKQEILATLDEQGCLDGLPFMPEMLQFCGQRIHVRAVAHKTCDTARQTLKVRRLETAVHLANLRCDGSAHGGCEAACTLFWKDAWLKPATNDVAPSQVNGGPHATASVCNEARLLASTQSQESVEGEEPCYSCQATKLYDATEPIAPWDVRQYLFDLLTGNHTVGRVLRVSWLATLRWLVNHVQRIRYIRSLCWHFSQWMHRLLTGRGVPSLFTTVQPCVHTPTGRLDLKPGELVRIKPKSEIEKTLDRTAKNRGLSFDPEEMAPYCGGTHRVRSSVTKLIDEFTGKMRHMKQPCIILEGVVCNAEYARCRLNCPRAFYSFWRELWLERVEAAPPSGASESDHRDTVRAGSPD